MSPINISWTTNDEDKTISFSHHSYSNDEEEDVELKVIHRYDVVLTCENLNSFMTHAKLDKLLEAYSS